MPVTYNPSLYRVSRVIAHMARQNTGIHPMDSGGATGRHWQHPLPKDPITLEVSKWTAADGKHYEEFMFRISTPHFLSATCKLHPYLDRQFRAYCAAHKDDYYLTCAEEWVAEGIAAGRFGRSSMHDTYNTYNDENDFDQDFQGVLFTRKLHTDAWPSYFVVLHTHNGADIRGGYSAPRVFEIGDEDEALGVFASWKVELYCAGCQNDVEADDCTFSGGGIPEDPAEEFHGLEVDMATLKITHKECGGEVMYRNEGFDNCW